MKDSDYMDSNMKCKNCRYSEQDKESFLLFCKNEKWNRNKNSLISLAHLVEPEDFCSKFEEKIEKLSEIEVEILKLAQKLGSVYVVFCSDELYFSKYKNGKDFDFVLKRRHFRKSSEEKIYEIDKLLENNQ